jgi:hypothetical protein
MNKITLKKHNHNKLKERTTEGPRQEKGQKRPQSCARDNCGPPHHGQQFALGSNKRQPIKALKQEKKK